MQFCSFEKLNQPNQQTKNKHQSFITIFDKNKDHRHLASMIVYVLEQI